MDMLKVGDKVMWRGSWGREIPMEATVIGIEVTEMPRTKYGIETSAVPWDTVRANCTLLTLDNGHWCYGSQVSPIEKVA